MKNTVSMTVTFKTVRLPKEDKFAGCFTDVTLSDTIGSVDAVFPANPRTKYLSVLSAQWYTAA
jgi:hypothetical protein